MRRDANGVVVPDEESLLPWGVVTGEVCAADGSTVVDIGLPDDRAFIVHAANHHARLADIVRRLAEQVEPDWRLFAHQLQITLDASALWDEMKGGGDE
jgi:hypothetical protein